LYSKSRLIKVYHCCVPINAFDLCYTCQCIFQRVKAIIVRILRMFNDSIYFYTRFVVRLIIRIIVSAKQKCFNVYEYVCVWVSYKWLSNEFLRCKCVGIQYLTIMLMQVEKHYIIKYETIREKIKAIVTFLNCFAFFHSKFFKCSHFDLFENANGKYLYIENIFDRP